LSERPSRYQRNLNLESSPQQANDLSDAFDLSKFFILLKKSLIWFVLFITICVAAVFLYLRYTNVKYQSTAELKLNKRSEASLFGFPTVSEESSNLNSLSGEVELIRSKLFLKEVVKQLPLDVTYELIGRFKNEERYKYIPFLLSYETECVNSTSFFVEIVDQNNFRISNDPESEKWISGSFGKPVRFNGCNYLLKKTGNFFADQTMFISIKNEEQVLDYLESKLQVAPENLNANTIRIAFEDYNPYKVQDIVQTISELYTDYSREQKNKANQLKITFLNTQLSEIESVLENYESYIESFTLKNKTSNPSRDLNEVIDQIINIDSTIYSIKYQKTNLQELKNNLQQDSINKLIIFNGTFNDQINKLITEYRDVADRLALAEMRYKGESQVIDEAKRELNLIDDRLKQAIAYSFETLDKQLERANQRKGNLISTFNELPAKSNELNQKMRFYSIYEELYLSLMQKKTEFQIAKAGTLAEVVILTPANYPRSSIGPSPKTLYIGSVILGVILCFVFLILRYLLYDQIISLTELERITRLPIVGTINRVRSGLAKKSGVLVFDKPRSQISENFRALRTGLNFMGMNKKEQVIAVTSSVSGEGKTFIAVNLAAVLSLSNKKVIILDLDMRKPRTQYAFNIEKNDEGISAILSGNASWEACVQKTQNENLHLIPSGVIPPNPAELLESEYFEQLISSLKDSYDIIILDTPPIGLVSDGIIALKHSNQSLYIVRSDYSKRGFIRDLHRNVELNQLKNISIVFNAAKNNKGGYGYYQDYYDESSKSLSNLKKIFNIG
jgi:capsular exopolysaccharide synthesis family protein